MRRLTSACAVLTSFALVAACTEEAATPPEAVPPSPAPTTPATPPVSYACESGQSITVAYPDVSTARLSHPQPARSQRGSRHGGAGTLQPAVIRACAYGADPGRRRHAGGRAAVPGPPAAPHR